MSEQLLLLFLPLSALSQGDRTSFSNLISESFCALWSTSLFTVPEHLRTFFESHRFDLLALPHLVIRLTRGVL